MKNEKQVKVAKDIVDTKGWTISKGTEISILKELTNPMTKKQMLIVRIDNGTELLDTMATTLICKEDLQEVQK